MADVLFFKDVHNILIFIFFPFVKKKCLVYRCYEPTVYVFTLADIYISIRVLVPSNADIPRYEFFLVQYVECIREDPIRQQQ